MANKTIKPVPLTEEQKREQLARAFFQKRASIAEMALANLCQNPSIDIDTVVDKAIAIADQMMDKLYAREAK